MLKLELSEDSFTGGRCSRISGKREVSLQQRVVMTTTRDMSNMNISTNISKTAQGQSGQTEIAGPDGGYQARYPAGSPDIT